MSHLNTALELTSLYSTNTSACACKKTLGQTQDHHRLSCTHAQGFIALLQRHLSMHPSPLPVCRSFVTAIHQLSTGAHRQAIIRRQTHPTITFISQSLSLSISAIIVTVADDFARRYYGRCLCRPSASQSPQRTSSRSLPASIHHDRPIKLMVGLSFIGRADERRKQADSSIVLRGAALINQAYTPLPSWAPLQGQQVICYRL